MLDSKRGLVKLENIQVVKEFSDVFPEELPSLPPEEKVDLSIEILPGMTPISRAPFKMAPTELKFNYRSSSTRDLFDPVFSLGCTYFVC